MQPARASAIAAVVFASVGLLGAAAALTYAHEDTSQHSTQGAATAAAHKDKHQDKHKDKAEHGAKANAENGDDASAAGRAHAEAMKAWARCVSEAASGPNANNAPVPPKTACGDKPAAPGLAKQGGRARSDSPGKSGQHKGPKAHDDSGSDAD
jgi:hypothetical protein